MMGDLSKGPLRLGCIRFAFSSILTLLLQIIFCPIADSTSLSTYGVSFSDKLGGFILQKVSGIGAVNDPFVLNARMTDSNGGTLSFQVPPDFGNMIGSQHDIGFAVTMVIENATNLPWTAFELELQSRPGIPSNDFDGLSFGQGSNEGRPFTASGFDHATIIDAPYDRVVFDQGRIAAGGHVTFQFVITDDPPYPPPAEYYLSLRPSKPVAGEPQPVRSDQVASR